LPTNNSTSAPARKPQERDVSGVAAYWAWRGSEVAARLERAAVGQSSAVAWGMAWRMARCAEEQNLWTARGLLNQDGEPFDGVGNLWSCGHRLCPSCCAAIARESRRQAREAISYLKTLLDAQTRWRWRFRSLVLTMPLMVGADVSEAIERINAAFSKLTNRMFWKSRLVGGVKSVEFTVRPDGYHAHIHLLVLSDFIPVDAQTEAKWKGYSKKHGLAPGNLRAELAHCLRAVGAQMEGEPVVAVYDVRRQGQRARGDNTISLEAALQETCKYVTKSESWDKIPDAQLVKVAEVARWRRMFELLGKARLSKREVPATDNERFEVEVAHDAEAAEPSLVHTPPLSNGDGVRGGRVETWRVMLTVKNFSEWCADMERRIERAREFRRDQLAWKYPCADFKTLDGESFGVKAQLCVLSDSSGETVQAA
jgi:hypothetical protein